MKQVGHALATATVIVLMGVATLFGRSQSGMFAAAAIFALPSAIAFALLKARPMGPLLRTYCLLLSILGGIFTGMLFLVGLAS